MIGKWKDCIKFYFKYFSQMFGFLLLMFSLIKRFHSYISSSFLTFIYLADSLYKVSLNLNKICKFSCLNKVCILIVLWQPNEQTLWAFDKNCSVLGNASNLQNHFVFSLPQLASCGDVYCLLTNGSWVIWPKCLLLSLADLGALFWSFTKK